MKDKKVKLSTKIIVGLIAIMTLSLFIIQYLLGITLNIGYAEGYFFVGLYVTTIGVILFTSKIIDMEKTVLDNKKNLKDNIRSANSEVDFKKLILPLVLVAGPFVISILGNIVTSPLFNSKMYSEQIGEIEEVKFEDFFEKLDLTKVPVVDKQLAIKLADKKLGERENLGSQVYVGEPVIQLHKGKLVWVAPLHHSGFFKWLSNMEGTPGYIVVSATNQRDVTYIDSHKIKYQPGSYFNFDITRKVRYSKEGYLEGLVDYSFELNEEGVPFWVISTYKNEKFLGLEEATGIITLNATTGEIAKYRLDQIPSWVDRAQPEYFITNQLQNRGKYIRGVFNFSNKDKFMISELGNIIYNKNSCSLFTGLTSIGADESITSFVSVDMKTKKVYKFNVSGATEYAASMSAEGKVQNLKYVASSPILVNIDGIPTYFMTLKDKEGLIKQYAFVSVKDYTTVATNENVDIAVKEYKKAVSQNSVGKEEIQTAADTTLTLPVVRIGSEKIENDLVYKFILDTKNIEKYKNKTIIFIAKSSISDELALTKEGDTLEIKFSEIDSDVIYVTSVENKTI